MAITNQDMIHALKDFTPATLRKARLFSSNVSWDDVGALVQVKAELRDILETPSKYMPLYKSVPIRLPTGTMPFTLNLIVVICVT